MKDIPVRVSVSYRSYILSYFKENLDSTTLIRKFPSPIGVIFSLIRIEIEYQNIKTVSVSYRSYILSYDFNEKKY